MDIEQRLESIDKNVKKLIEIINEVVIELEECKRHRKELYKQNALITKRLNGNTE